MFLEVAKVNIEGDYWWEIKVVENDTQEDDEADMTFLIKSQGLNGECIDADITGFLKNFAENKNIRFQLDSIISDASRF